MYIKKLRIGLLVGLSFFSAFSSAEGVKVDNSKVNNFMSLIVAPDEDKFGTAYKQGYDAGACLSLAFAIHSIDDKNVKAKVYVDAAELLNVKIDRLSDFCQEKVKISKLFKE